MKFARPKQNLSLFSVSILFSFFYSSEVRRTHINHLENLKPAPGPEDEICRNFDPSTSNPKDFDYRTLAHYRQIEYRGEDRFSDFALWTELSLMIEDKLQRAHGVMDARNLVLYSNNDEANAARAFACMKISPPAVPLRQDTIAPLVDPDRLGSELEKAGLVKNEIDRILAKKDQFLIYGHENPFAVKEFAEALFQVIHEESSVVPTSSKPINWTPDFLKTQNSFSRMLQKGIASKLLIALANGSSARHFRTGKEDGLETWVMAQPERSVFPVELFRQSYRLNSGDVYLSLLTIENILSQYFIVPNRENLVQTNHLGTIINHLNGPADLYGPWYHLWGTILYGYTTGPARGRLAADVETFNGFFSKDLSDQEDISNRAGSEIGVALQKWMKENGTQNWVSHPEYLEKTRYLHLTEDYSDQIRKFWKKYQARFN